MITRLNLPDPRFRTEVTHEAWTPSSPINHPGWYDDDPFTWATMHAASYLGPGAAMRVSVVNRCVSLIANMVASLPCLLYEQRGDVKERAREHPAYKAVRRKPNAWQTRSQFFRDMQAKVSLFGYATARVDRFKNLFSMRPLDPRRVEVKQFDDGRLRFEYHDPRNGEKEDILQDEMLYVRDISQDFAVGMARAALAREAIAVSTAAEAFVRRFFVHDATGRLVIKHPAAMPAREKREEYEAYLRETVMGVHNARRPFISWGGAEVSSIEGMGDEDFLVDPRKFQAADIARFWGVPGFLIGLEEKSTSWGTGIAEQKQGFVDFTIKPETINWAESLAQVLLDDEEQEEMFFEFEFGALLQGNPTEQATAFKTYKEMGVFSPNEIRSKLNENPREGGDTYQDNSPGAPPNEPEPPPAPPDDEEAEAEARAIPEPLLADAADRIAGAIAHGGRAKKAEYVHKTVRPLVEAYGLPAWLTEACAERIAARPAPSDADERLYLVISILRETLQAGALAPAEAA